MKVDIGEVLTRAWQISWKNKTLWWFGIFLGLFVFIIILPVMLVPVVSLTFLRGERPYLFFLAIAGFLVVFAIFFVIIYPVSAIFQTAVTLGTKKAIQNEEMMPLADLVKKSLSFFWRVLGVMATYALVVTMLNFIIQGIVFLLAIVTFGVGMLCATPLTLLQYPIIFIAVAWMEQAVNGVVLDNMKLEDAIKQGWQIIRDNKSSIGLLIVVVYFGVSIVSMVVVLPMMAPMFFVPFALLKGNLNWLLIVIPLLCSVIFVPLYAILCGWSTVFTKSVWVLAYLRLTKPQDHAPVVLDVDA